MKRIIIITWLISSGLTLVAQNGYETILQQIEANNTTLDALRRQTEAQKLGNRTGIAPSNPEAEFHYLWGNPSVVGIRTDISVTQTFDFPTAYVHRNKIAGLQNENAELSYKAGRLNVLLSAKQACIELSYYNALAKEYAIRLQNAERMAEVYKIKMEKGESNILEFNKAQLSLTAVQAELAQVEAGHTAILSELKLLNGGKEIVFSDTNLSISPMEKVWEEGLPANFEDWYAQAEAQSPILQYVSTQIEIERQQVKLNRAMGLPRLSAGYLSEKVVGQHFQGVTAGVSIPLWENKNRIKYAKAQVQAAEAALNDSKTQFYHRLQALYQKAAALQQNAKKIRLSLAGNNNEPLLKKALDAGEISLLNYLLETEFYYNAINKALEADRDFELTAAELRAVEM